MSYYLNNCFKLLVQHLQCNSGKVATNKHTNTTSHVSNDVTHPIWVSSMSQDVLVILCLGPGCQLVPVQCIALRSVGSRCPRPFKWAPTWLVLVLFVSCCCCAANGKKVSPGPGQSLPPPSCPVANPHLLHHPPSHPIPVARVSYNGRGGWADLILILTKLSRSPSLCHQCTPAILGWINTCGNRNGEPCSSTTGYI